MLLRFRFSNFRSFREEQELSLIAGSFKDRADGVFNVAGLNEGVLPVAAIYGANASGKTTVLRALQFLHDVILDSHRFWKPERSIPRVPFVRDIESPSRFVIDFIRDGIRHQYGFAVDSSAILEEWLHVYPKGKRQVWFSRRLGKPFSFSAKLTGENKMIGQLTRNNSLFLSAAAQNNHELLLPVYKWVSRFLVFVIGDRDVWQLRTASMCNEIETRALMAQLLRVADLGISDVQVAEESDGIMEALRSAWSAKGEVSSLDESIPVIQLIHRLGDKELPFDLAQESAGTIAYLGLLSPIVNALSTGGLICIDELDASLHPLMAVEIMRLFGNRSRNPKGAQLLFNTHDTNLLSSGVLRRDQIWFTEKDKNGESHLYPLTDFKPRRQENLENGYLQGRYGAIPFIHSDELMTSLALGDGEEA
jgi:AAA15 family ATPase/GTPase